MIRTSLSFEIWQNEFEITESAWSLQEYDISSVADDYPSVYIRWGYKISSSAWAYSGWNIDDVEIFCVVPLGDMNADGSVDYDDFNLMADCLDGPEAQFGAGCSRGDMDFDDDVDMSDFATFQNAASE